MGYNSKVTIVTTIGGFTAMKLDVAATIASKNADYNLMEHMGYCKFNRKEGYVRFGWNWLKWYENDYPEVTAIMSALEKLNEADIPYIYCRIGEDETDIDLNQMDPEGILPTTYTETTTDFVVDASEDEEVDMDKADLSFGSAD